MQKDCPPTTNVASPAARGRGRPRAFDRDAALATATKLFWSKGYEATSIADLTTAMGIGSPSLYAAFGSKEQLFVEALGHYRANYEGLVWDNFFAAATAREAVKRLLIDSAAAFTGEICDIPTGCMVTLSSAGSEGYASLGDLVRSSRGIVFDRIRERIERASQEGEIPAAVDARALARFVQSIQHGMSILARDNVNRGDLESIADVAMGGWDAWLARFAHS